MTTLVTHIFEDIGVNLFMWWLTHTVQRLQPYNHSLQLSATVLTHVAHSILSHETPTITPMNWLASNDMQIPICGFQNEATIIHQQFCNPTKTPTHLTKVHQTQLHTVKFRI